MDYIKNNYKGFVFQTDLSQVFVNKPITNVDEKNVIKLRSEKHISDSDMDIVRFLFNNRFATKEMLLQYLKKYKKTIDELEKELSRLVKYRIINAFALLEGDFKGGVKPLIPIDALLIYCLDIGGRVLIGHFYSADTTGWNTTENMRGAERIGKDLQSNEFYMHLLIDSKYNECPKNYFKTNPCYTLKQMKVEPSFELCIKNKNDFKYYIGDIVRRFDFPVEYREHLSKLESILVTNAWKKYFFDIEKVPTILFVCEDDAHALELAKIIKASTSFEASTGYRITTDERLKRGLGTKGAFLAYDETTNTLIEKTMAAFR